MKLARKLPGWGRVLPVDFGLAVGIIGITMASVMPQFERNVTQAYLIESLLGSKSAWSLRFELMERMALTGEGLQANVAAPSSADTSQQRDDVEAALGAKHTGSRVEQSRATVASNKVESFDAGGDKKAMEKRERLLDNLRSNRSTDGAKYEALVVDGGIIIRGVLEGTAQPFYLTFTPSVIADGVPGSILWLCGNKRAPPGWIRLGQGNTNLPVEFQLAGCRNSPNH